MRPDEVERVRGLVGASFLLGAALVLFYGSANAIFLTRYDVTSLPWVYIVNGVVVVVVGLLYGALSARVAVGRALVAMSVLMTISIGALWAWATISDGRAVAFALAVWFRLLFIFAVLGLWEIASAVFDIRQAKRLFAAVALGLMLAFVAGGIATPVLSSALGTVNLVGVAAVCFALYTVDFRRLLARHEVGRHADAATVRPAGPAEILTDRYSRRMVWMKSVTILLLYVTEYVFYEQAATTFDTEDSLAGFLGVFLGVMTILMIVVTGVVSGRYISRFGIRVATLTLPAAMVVVAVPAGLYGTLVGIDTLFFALVCATLATDHIVGNAIGEPAGAVLFQPMPAERRMRVRLAVDGWLGSVALVGSGVLLLVFEAVDLATVAPYLFAVAGIAAAGVAVAVLQYRDYVGALRSATTLGFAGAAGPMVLDGLDHTLVGDRSRAGDPAAVLGTAGMVRSLEDEPLDILLPTLAGHRSPDVVEMALDAIARRGDHADCPTVEHVVDRDDLPVATRARALSALGALDPGLAAARTATELDGGQPAVALAAALADPELLERAVLRLRELAASADRTDRLAACRALEVWPGGEGGEVEMLVALLRDRDPDVVDAALDAAADRLSEPVCSEVLCRLTDPAHRRRAIRALSAGGPTVVEDLDAATATWPDDVVADVVVAVLAGRVAPERIALRYLAPDTPSVVRRAAYRAIAGTDVSVRAHVGDDLALLAAVVAAHRDVGDGVPAVRDALAEEFDLVRRSIYAALGVEYGQGRLDDIETLVRLGDEDDRANAIEALDVVLVADHRQAVIAALEPPDVEGAAARWPAPLPPRPAHDWLAELRDDRRLTGWSRRVVTDHLDRTTRPDGGAEVDPTIAKVLSLARVDIFSTLSYDTLVELAALVRLRSVEAGTVILVAGSVGRELYTLTSGTVEVRTVDGTVRRLEEGTVFGELAVIDPAPRNATVTAATPVELIVVPRATVLALADRRPAVMAEIARVLARRLRATP